MKTSIDRILTTHTGSLPRPKPLIDLILNREKDGAVDARAFEAETANAVDDAVARQIAAGIDVDQRWRDEQAVVHNLHPPPGERHRA